MAVIPLNTSSFHQLMGASHVELSSGTIPEPIKNNPKTRNTMPMCSIPMLDTTFVSDKPPGFTTLRFLLETRRWSVLPPRLAGLLHEEREPPSPLSVDWELNRLSLAFFISSRLLRCRLMAKAECRPTECILKSMNINISSKSNRTVLILMEMKSRLKICTCTPLVLHSSEKGRLPGHVS